MNSGAAQQLVISGVGGQGVLFLTRLLAEAALEKGLPVFTSETHGMAQRGGTVISHLKVGDFSSPMIRPGFADGLLILKDENLNLHAGYGRTGAWAVVNSRDFDSLPQAGQGLKITAVDAGALARSVNSARSVNLVILGCAMAVCPDMFCSPEDLLGVLEKRLANDKDRFRKAGAALEAGMKAAN